MSLTKHAVFTVLAAKIAPAGGGPLMRTAHRHEFKYEPRPGYLYVRSRMISSRTNDNFDHFPAEEIKTAYKTFIGKPVFVNHHNDNHRRARGVIKDAVLHEDVNPDGTQDTWVEGLMEVDAIRFPKLAKAILAGEIDRTSMGTDVAFSVCSVCNNKAASPVDYCKHIPKMKGQKVWRTTASGEKEGILVYEKCYGLGFFENSLLVEEPADPTAYFLGVDARGVEGMAKAAKALFRRTAEIEPVEVAGLAIQAADTGRVLMIQRSFKDEDDPARGTWEFPGGHLDDDEHPPTAAIREFTEEVGCAPPHGDLVASWRSGPIYQGFLMVVPTEADVDIHCRAEGRALNPDDPKGDDLEAVAWWLPQDAKANPALRPEVKDGTDWTIFEDAMTKTSAGPGKDLHRGDTWRSFDPHPDPLVAREPSRSEEFDNANQAYFDGLHDGMYALKPMSDKYREEATALAYEEGYEVGLGQVAAMRTGVKVAMPGKFPTSHEPKAFPDPSGWVAGCSCGWRGQATGADRILAHLKAVLHANKVAWSQGLDTGLMGRIEVGEGAEANPAKPTPETVGRVPEHMQRDPSHPRQWQLAARTASVYDYAISLACGDSVRYSGSASGQVAQGQTWSCSTHGQTTVSDVSGPGATSNGLGMDTTSGRRTAASTLAPAEVDTLRDEQCPVCGESDAYDGDKCQVCGFLPPPEEFGDPDLEKAKQTDLRQDQDDLDDQGGDLACDSCGATFASEAAAKTAVVLDRDKGTDESDEAASTAAQVGDTCPTCGEGTLQPAAVAPGDDAVADTGFAPAGSAAKPGDPEDDPDDADGPDGADGEDGAGLSDDSDDEDDDEDEGSDEENPFPPKKKKPTANRRGVRSQKEQSMRPALAALAAQQQQIHDLQQTLAFVVQAAGLDKHPRVASLLKSAADENPAFGGGWANGAPVEGSPEAPSESTQQAATPTAKDSVEDVGSTPLTDVTPDATTSLDSAEVVLDVTEPQEQDVTAPVAGTEDLGKGGRGQEGTNRIETDVRAGTPSDNSAAFRDGGFLGAKDESRTIASLRLARLQITAGIAAGDDLDLGTFIASSDRSDESIQAEIATLAKVVEASRTPQRVARNLVPQGARQAQRMVPSMTADAGIVAEASIGSISDEEMAFE